MAELTFRDFAGAVMSGRMDEAARVLGELLELDPAAAGRAAGHFDAQMKAGGQEFMAKAMGLRHAVTSGDEAHIGRLLADCFGLEGKPLGAATAALRRRYG